MSPTRASAPASSTWSERSEATAIEWIPTAFAVATSSRVSPTSAVLLVGQSPGGGRAEADETAAHSASAAEAPCPRGKEAGEPEPLEAGPRDRLRIARDES